MDSCRTNIDALLGSSMDSDAYARPYLELSAYSMIQFEPSLIIFTLAKRSDKAWLAAPLIAWLESGLIVTALALASVLINSSSLPAQPTADGRVMVIAPDVALARMIESTILAA